MDPLENTGKLKGTKQMLNRRNFIKTMLSTGVVLGGASLAGGCSGLKRQDMPDLSNNQDNLPMLDETSKAILSQAALAPSGHNSQPWRVRIENRETWIIEADPDRSLPVVDSENRELLLSLGAFVENLSLAAGAMGWSMDMQVLATGRRDRDVVRVSLHKGKPTGYELRNLQKRRTIKHGLLPKEITLSDVRVLENQTEGRLAFFPRGSAHASCLRDAAVENFRIQAHRDDAQQELVRWLRLDDLSIRKYRDGLSPEGMEITGIKGWFIRHFVKPEDFLKESYRKQSVDITSDLAGEGGGWIVLTSPGETVPDLIATGRFFQRIALSAYELGIGLHPMTQMLEEKNGISQIAAHHGTGFYPQFVLRAGYVEHYPEPVSPRRPVEWFTYDNGQPGMS